MAVRRLRLVVAVHRWGTKAQVRPGHLTRPPVVHDDHGAAPDEDAAVIGVPKFINKKVGFKNL